MIAAFAVNVTATVLHTFHQTFKLSFIHSFVAPLLSSLLLYCIAYDAMARHGKASGHLNGHDADKSSCCLLLVQGWILGLETLSGLTRCLFFVTVKM